MTDSPSRAMDDVARAALSVGDVRSAVIFVLAPGSSDLELTAVAGIDGPSLDGLVAAVRNPAHPIVRTLADDGPTFDVLPMNPGGPRLRSHLPLRVDDATIGVLALAHESPLSDAQRQAMIALAAEASAAV